MLRFYIYNASAELISPSLLAVRLSPGVLPGYRLAAWVSPGFLAEHGSSVPCSSVVLKSKPVWLLGSDGCGPHSCVVSLPAASGSSWTVDEPTPPHWQVILYHDSQGSQFLAPFLMSIDWSSSLPGKRGASSPIRSSAPSAELQIFITTGLPGKSL